MCEINSSEWIEKLLFRDNLRLHPHVFKEYASKYKFDGPTYTKKKEPFIKTIIEIAIKEMYNK